MSSTVNKRLDAINELLEAEVIGTRVSIISSMGMSKEGLPLDTVIITIGEDEIYAMYSSTSSIGISTYLNGLKHGFQLVFGDYRFKPLSRKAKIAFPASPRMKSKSRPCGKESVDK